MTEEEFQDKLMSLIRERTDLSTGIRVKLYNEILILMGKFMKGKNDQSK
jgi:hypothetical protein